MPSTVRMHKLTVLAKVDIVRRIGMLSELDRELIGSSLCRAFCPPETVE